MAGRDEAAGTADDLDEADREPLEETLKSEPDAEAVDEPTTDSRQEAAESGWMVRNLTSITVVSVFMTLLVALALLQATGLVDLLGPVVDSELGQWAVFVVLGLAVLALFAWSRHRV